MNTRAHCNKVTTFYGLTKRKGKEGKVIKKDWTMNNKIWILKIKDQGQVRGSGRSKSHHKNSASSRFEPKK